MPEAHTLKPTMAVGLDELVLPAIESVTFVAGCMVIHANRERPDATADVLLLIAWMFGVLSLLAGLTYQT